MKRPRIVTYDVVETAAGWVGLGYSECGLCWLSFPLPSRTEAIASLQHLAPDAGLGGPDDLAGQIRAYFAGERVDFQTMTDLSAGTPFQQRIWELVRTIPYGEVRTYNWVARLAGKPGAARATGAALGANPVPIVIPCHRVIGADGGLCGFGGGLDLKRRLLDLEGGLAAIRRS